MKLILRQSRPGPDAQPATPPGVPYVTIGDKSLVPAESLASADGHSDERVGSPLPVATGDLFLIVQEGRLFQRAHPDVRVVLDRGRHLVVELGRGQASRLNGLETPDYAIRPLEPGMTIVSVPPRSRTSAPALDWVQALVDRVERGSYEEVLTRLTGFATRHSTSPQFLEASAFVRDELTALGYELRFESVDVRGATTRNVIAERLGAGASPRDLVYVVAHLDSVNHEGGPAAPAPGADDNGSGSAGVIAIGRALLDHSARHDLRLVLFGGEEQGLFGSRSHVLNLAPEDRARIKTVINMDMIGNRNTATNAVLIEGGAVSQPVIDALVAAAATYTSLEVETSLFPFNSDHVPFIDAGLPAVLTIEGADGANQAVHGPDDVLADIELDLALEILRMNVAAVALALGRVDP